MRLVHELVTDGGSPLYDRAAAGEISAVARPRPRRAGAPLMYDLAGLAVAAACFAFAFFLVWVLAKI